MPQYGSDARFGHHVGDGGQSRSANSGYRYVLEADPQREAIAVIGP
jgi:hypothetical protein